MSKGNKTPVASGGPQADRPTMRPILHSVRFREPIAWSATSLEYVKPLEKEEFEIAVSGPSVFVVARPGSIADMKKSGTRDEIQDGIKDACLAHGIAPEAKAIRVAVEVPRQACILRWIVPAEATAADVVQAVFGQGGFSAVHVCPDGRIRELRHKIALQKELDAASRSASAKAEELRPASAAKADEDDDDVGFGEEAEE